MFMFMSFLVEMKNNYFKYSVYKTKNIKLFIRICLFNFF